MEYELKAQDVISDPVQWLKSTGRFTFEYPSSEQTMVLGVDISAHFEKIKLNIPEEYRWMLKALADYVKAPVVVDDFPSEMERNAWQKKEVHPKSEVNEVFESNKLKGNFIDRVFGPAEVAKVEDWLSFDILEKYEELNTEYKGSDGAPSGYDKMTIEKKKFFANKLADFAKDLYQALVEILEKKQQRENDLLFLKALDDYIKAPVFTNEPSLEKVEIENRLSPNLVNNVLLVAGMEIENLKSESGLDTRYKELLRECTSLNGVIGGGYNRMTLKQRITFTEKLADFAKDLHGALAKRYASKETSK